jgi:hypothetical protein
MERAEQARARQAYRKQQRGKGLARDAPTALLDLLNEASYEAF